MPICISCKEITISMKIASPRELTTSVTRSLGVGRVHEVAYCLSFLISPGKNACLGRFLPVEENGFKNYTITGREMCLKDINHIFTLFDATSVDVNYFTTNNKLLLPLFRDFFSYWKLRGLFASTITGGNYKT